MLTHDYWMAVSKEALWPGLAGIVPWDRPEEASGHCDRDLVVKAGMSKESLWAKSTPND